MSDKCLPNLEKVYTNKIMGLMGLNSFPGYTGLQLWSAGFNNDIWNKNNKVCKHWKKCIFLLCSRLAEGRLYYLNIRTCITFFQKYLASYFRHSYTSSCLLHIKYKINSCFPVNLEQCFIFCISYKDYPGFMLTNKLLILPHRIPPPLLSLCHCFS